VRLHTAQDRILSTPVDAADRVGRPGAVVYGSQVVLSRQDFLPLDRTLDVKTVRYDTLKVAKRLEAELGDEQASCIEGDASAWDLLPLPEGALKVGIDGGYVRHGVDKKRNFEVIVGKRTLSVGEGEEAEIFWHKRCGFVQTYDDAKPKRRLHEVLHAQGLQMNQAMTFLSDGNDTLRVLQVAMSPKATHILDWLHLTMKLTVLGQYGKGLVQCEAELGKQICDQIERRKWSLWHRQVDKVLAKINDLQTSVAQFITATRGRKVDCLARSDQTCCSISSILRGWAGR
jgi:hypothetical protein